MLHNAEAVEFAVVQLMPGNISVIADANGRFLISNLNGSIYSIKVSSVSFLTKELKIDLSTGSLNIDIELEEDRLDLNEVVISGTRYGLDKRENPVIVNVISPRILDASQSNTISEGLQFQSGLRVENNCQNCGYSQIRLNGLEGAYSQILINSRAVFSALNGVYGLDQIPSNIVERIEIVRSGGSALYGSNAIAGTVNIITKDPVFNSWRVSSNLAMIDGQRLDRTSNFNSTLVNKDLNKGITIYGFHRNRSAYDANKDGFTEITELHNYLIGSKAFINTSKLSKLSVDFSAIREYRRGGDRLSLAPQFTDITERLLSNTAFYGLTFDQYLDKGKKNKLSSYVSGQVTSRDSYYGGLGGGTTREDSILAQNAFGKTDDNSIVLGLQYTKTMSSGDIVVMGIEQQSNQVYDEIPGYQRIIDQNTNNTGFYLQYEKRIGNRIKLLPGARYDYSIINGNYELDTIRRKSNRNFGVISPRLTVLYDLTPQLQLRTGYARGFRAPQAFNEDLHISSVAGEPQFVILSNDLEKETSNAYTFSLNYTRSIQKTQLNALFEGFYTELNNPFTIVSTGLTLENGSILKEVRNGQGAIVRGFNFDLNVSPSANYQIQLGGTIQEFFYKKEQVLFESMEDSGTPETISTKSFTRNPNVYGFIASTWKAWENFSIDLTGNYSGTMTVPRVVRDDGFIELTESQPFYELNFKMTYHVDMGKSLVLEFYGGIQNIFNSYQSDFSTGPQRDSDYIYGPGRPRTYFFGIRLGNYH